MADVLGSPIGAVDNRYAAMSFRAIFAGWLVATGIAATLYLGGLALGFTAFHAEDAAASIKGIGIGTSIWMVLSWIVSLWSGGMFASWYAAHEDRTIGSLHGVAVWGLSVTAVFLWAGLGMSAMHHDAGPMHGDMSPSSPGMADSARGPSLMGNGSLAVLQADVNARLTSHDRGVGDNITAALLAGHDDIAANLFAAGNGTTSADGARIVATIAADTQAAQFDVKQRADRAAHYAAAMLWTAFLSVLLGLIAAALGGWLGANHIGRIYHLRTYGMR